MEIDPTGSTLYVGFDTSGTLAGATLPGATTITNFGTATTYPKIKIKRSGGTSATIRYIQNATQGTTLYSSYAMRDGETITIDLQEKTVTTDFGGENIVGDVIERNSDFGRFGLLPGANELTTLVETAGSPTVTAWLEWRTTHWSADGAAA
jgi:phage-related protein